MGYYQGDYLGGSGYYQGGPLLLGIGRLLGRIGPKILRGAGRLAGRAVRGARGALRRPIVRGTIAAAGGGAAVELALKRRGEVAGMPGLRGRRINPANAKALRRALRRVQGFGKLVKRSKRAVSRAYSAMGLRRATVKRPFARRR